MKFKTIYYDNIPWYYNLHLVGSSYSIKHASLDPACTYMYCIKHTSLDQACTMYYISSILVWSYSIKHASLEKASLTCLGQASGAFPNAVLWTAAAFPFSVACFLISALSSGLNVVVYSSSQMDLRSLVALSAHFPLLC